MPHAAHPSRTSPSERRPGPVSQESKSAPEKDTTEASAPDIAALRALADETRLAIVTALGREGELCACKLLERLDVSQSTLSHHMKVLVSASLVAQRREGRWMRYRLEPGRLALLSRAVAKLGGTKGTGDKQEPGRHA